MSTLIEPVREMILAHFAGNDEAFQRAAQGYAHEERRRRHPVVAESVEQLLKEATKRTGKEANLTPFRGVTSEIPVDRDKGVPLLEVRTACRELDSLVFGEETEQALARVLRENRDSELLRAHNLEPAKKILFCGPPGTGKTAAAEAVAQALYIPLAIVRFDSVVASYLGETAANLRKVFEFARTHAMVLFLDEFDAVGRERGDANEHGELKRVVTSLLQMMDSFRGETILIAATNHQSLLDSALWRRFDELVFFPMPDAAIIEKLLVQYFRQIKVEKGVLLSSVAEQLASLDVCQADVERLAITALKQTIMSGKKAVSSDIIQEVIAQQQKRSQHLSQWNHA
jgi:SpoVK/Ycf46/Vps4 family AAA+-type ATPase